jgi:hypothetical protein
MNWITLRDYLRDHKSFTEQLPKLTRQFRLSSSPEFYYEGFSPKVEKYRITLNSTKGGTRPCPPI